MVVIYIYIYRDTCAYDGVYTYRFPHVLLIFFYQIPPHSWRTAFASDETQDASEPRGPGGHSNVDGLRVGIFINRW